MVCSSIDEYDDRARRFVDLLEDGFQPVLELAAVLRTGKKRPQVEGENLLVSQRLRHVALHDPLRQTFNYGRFPHTRLADDYRVVLRAPRENLHHPPDLVVPAYDRVELAFSCLLGQIPAILLEGLVLLFRVLVGDPLRPPYILQDRVNPVLRDALGLKQSRSRPFAAIGYADEQVLRADVFVLQPLRFSHGDVDGLLEGGPHVDLPPRTLDPGQPGKLFVDFRAKAGHACAQLLKDGPDRPFLLLKQGIEQMVVLKTLLSQLLGLFLRLGDRILRLDREFI